MHRASRVSFVLPVAFVVAGAGTMAHANPIYREIFPNNTGGDLRPIGSGNTHGTFAPANTGWQLWANTSETATAVSNETNNSNQTGLAFDTPLGSSAVAINSNPSSPGTGNNAAGRTFTGLGTWGAYLLFTDEYTVDTTATPVASVSWMTRNTSSSETSRVAVRIADQWYASNATFTNANSWETKTFTFTTAASAWRTVAFAEGSPLLVSTTTLTSPLPAGNITAFGLFTDNSNDTARIDDFTINAVPEPASLALLALGGLAIAGRRRD